MILLDYNQVILAALFQSIGNHHNADINEDMIRHMFLNSLRANRNKFAKNYGEIVICADGKSSWRKGEFPYYKANRKKTRDESELDWGELYRIIALVREELDEHFPYKVMHFDHLEADDIIGAICEELGTELNMGCEQILILSADKDFAQLQKYANVSQYDPIQKKSIVHGDPSSYLFEHILKGDSGDGIPNILSEDNCLVIGKRQKSMTSKKIAMFTNDFAAMEETEKHRFIRNQKLIDLSFIPDKYKKEVTDKYAEPKTLGRTKLFKYFISRGLRNLVEDIGDF
jgi:5'-3' exonuclease